MRSALIATPSAEAAAAIIGCLGSDWEAETASERAGFLARFHERRPDILFVDLGFLASDPAAEFPDYRPALAPLLQASPVTQVVVMAAQADIRHAVSAVKAGAADYLTYPVNPAEVGLVAESAFESLRTRSELEYLRDQFWKREVLEFVHTLNPEMKRVFDQVKSVAPTRSTVLFTGETGTGKGVLAKLVHVHSQRADQQFIQLHCGAIPDTLIESELFGHERGAFTGAVKRKMGKFEIAQGGTLFLDEIGTISPAVQVKLLQVLQDRCFQRVGGEAAIQADVRVLAATNEDLEELVAAGRFRKDLYYRLNVFPIEIPPLRERLEDLPFLVQSILQQLNSRHFRDIRAVHPAVMEALRHYHWPGNIRELENILERAYIIEDENTLTAESFPAELFADAGGQAQIPLDLGRPLAEVREDAIEEIERKYLSEQLAVHGGRIAPTAQAAGIGTRQLHKLMKKYGLDKADYKSRKG